MTGTGVPRGAAPDAPGRPGACAAKGGGGSRGEDSLFRNAYALMLSTGVSAALGLGFWLIAARHYTEEAVGQGSAAIAAQRMLASVTATTLSGAVVRYVPRAGRATGPLVARLYLLSTVVVAAASGIFLLTLDLWGPSYAPLGTLSAGLFFTLSSVGWALLTLQDGVLTGLRKAFWVPVGNAVFSLGKLVLLVVLAAALPVLGVFVSWAAAIALSTVPLAWLVFRRLIPQQARADRDREPPSYREIGRFVAGDAAGAFFSLAMISLLPVMVAVRFDAAHNAFFYTAYTVGGTMEFMAINMASSLTAHASHSPESLAEGVRGALRRMVLLLVPVVLVLVLFAPLVLTPFGRGYTDHGSTVLRLLAAGALPRVAVELYIGVLRVQGRTGVLAAVQAGMCVLVLGGAAVLLGPYGISGAGWAVLGGMTVMAAACAPGLRAVLKGREPGAPAAPDDDGYGTDWARQRARSRATAARDAVTPAYGVPVDAVTPAYGTPVGAVTPAYGTSVDAPRPRAPGPVPGARPPAARDRALPAVRWALLAVAVLAFWPPLASAAPLGAARPSGPDLLAALPVPTLLAGLALIGLQGAAVGPRAFRGGYAGAVLLATFLALHTAPPLLGVLPPVAAGPGAELLGTGPAARFAPVVAQGLCLVLAAVLLRLLGASGRTTAGAVWVLTWAGWTAQQPLAAGPLPLLLGLSGVTAVVYAVRGPRS
ncbi:MULTISPECIES: lipopolysaccharide biosynthesis protein [unclassified Streptomyces]|uniref:lipopolysaccharide biosynthesis protein n=1 Tax=unclassified Streptomyces TaxID=2593676 RepID=UPI0035E27183